MSGSVMHQVADDEQAVELLETLVGIPSPSGQEEAVARAAVQWMTKLGLHATVDEAGNAVGRLGDGTREILLLGHIDTVSGIVPVRREGDKLYGRGAVDAKGPFCAFIAATSRVDVAPGWRISVVGAVEEESASSKGARYVARTMASPEYVVIGEPSSWQRITLGYKGRMLIAYGLERSMTHTAGEAVGVAERAFFFWQAIRGYADEWNAEKSRRFETLDPSLRSLRTDSDGLSERVEMHLGLRLPLGLDAGDLQAFAESEAGEAELRFRGIEQPYRGDKRNPLTRAFLSSIREQGERASFVLKTGTSDMNVLGSVWDCPMVAYGPGDSAQDHTPHEHIQVSEYLQAIRVLEGVLQRLTA